VRVYFVEKLRAAQLLVLEIRDCARSGQTAGGTPLLESFDVRVGEQQCAMWRSHSCSGRGAWRDAARPARIAVARKAASPGITPKMPFRPVSGPSCLRSKFRFPETETLVRRDAVRMRDY
jgi:hypothetical protein